MQQSIIYLGIYIIEYYFFWKIRVLQEVRSTGGARGSVGGTVPWPEVPVCVEALLGGNGRAGWLAVGPEQRTTVRGGA
jgi:hypothetical protein